MIIHIYCGHPIRSGSESMAETKRVLVKEAVVLASAALGLLALYAFVKLVSFVANLPSP